MWENIRTTAMVVGFTFYAVALTAIATCVANLVNHFIKGDSK